LQGATAADSQRVFGNYELERGMKISDESCWRQLNKDLILISVFYLIRGGK
jgi:hypothetical protein